MTLSRRARLALAAVMALGLAVIYLPLFVVLISSFNTDRTFSWPPNGLHARLVGPRAGTTPAPERRSAPR